MLFAIIFLLAFLALGGFALYLSRTIDHGEARFDSKTGQPLSDTSQPTEPIRRGPAKPAQRISQTDQDKRTTDDE